MLCKLVFFLLLFAVCLYIASKSHHIPLNPFQMSRKDTHFSRAWHPDYFFPNGLQEKNTCNVLFGQDFFFFCQMYFFRVTGGGGQSPSHSFIDENRYIL